MDYTNHVMKIALDFDSTVWPLLPAMGISYEEVTYWGHLPDMLGGIDSMNQAFTKVMPFEHAVVHPPFPGCVEVLQDLESQGVEIHVITHRETHYRDDVVRYAEHYNIPIHNLDCSPHVDKVATCQERGINILVDDHPDIITQAAKLGLDAYMLLFQYNHHAQQHGVIGCESWSELDIHLRTSLGL
jgi:phosphoglycolate phosphatase-like HAD superfamily hydrolase